MYTFMLSAAGDKPEKTSRTKSEIDTKEETGHNGSDIVGRGRGFEKLTAGLVINQICTLVYRSTGDADFRAPMRASSTQHAGSARNGSAGIKLLFFWKSVDVRIPQHRLTDQPKSGGSVQ